MRQTKGTFSVRYTHLFPCMNLTLNGIAFLHLPTRKSQLPNDSGKSRECMIPRIMNNITATTLTILLTTVVLSDFETHVLFVYSHGFYFCLKERKVCSCFVYLIQIHVPLGFYLYFIFIFVRKKEEKK